MYFILFGEEREIFFCGKFYFFWGYKIEVGEVLQEMYFYN